jgi:molybdate transport system ATP-binding protein
MALDVRIRQRLGGFVLDAQFAAPDGVTALFGPSGAGKSSIVRAVAGLSRPQQGRIELAGRLVLDSDRKLFVPPESRRAALVFQDARLFPHMTVADNLLFGWRRAPVKAGPKEIADVVALLGLETLTARMPRHLSGGEKGRVALGRALLAAPDILLLDEPLASLDAGRRAEILPYLERLRDAHRVPMLYVSHAVEEVARLADRVVLVRDGRVTGQGPVFDMLTGHHPGFAPQGAVLEARVRGVRGDGLTELTFDGGVLALAAAPAAGGRLRLRIAAEDILIAREEPKAISANNILAVTVMRIATDGPLADVELACGGAKLVARITTASATRLALAPGMAAYAIIKSVTVDRPSTEAP